METLTKAVLEKLGSYKNEHGFLNNEWVDLFVCRHQEQYPGSWQDWDVDSRAEELAELIQSGADDGETTIERILQRA